MHARVVPGREFRVGAVCVGIAVSPNGRHRDLSLGIGHLLELRMTGRSKHHLAIGALSLKPSYRPSRHYQHSYHNERSFHHVLLVRSVSFSDADGFYRESPREPRMDRSADSWFYASFSTAKVYAWRGVNQEQQPVLPVPTDSRNVVFPITKQSKGVSPNETHSRDYIVMYGCGHKQPSQGSAE